MLLRIGKLHAILLTVNNYSKENVMKIEVKRPVPVCPPINGVQITLNIEEAKILLTALRGIKVQTRGMAIGIIIEELQAILCAD